MGVTKAQLIGDIELRISSSKPSDDFEIEYSQIAHWLTIYRDELVKEYLESRLKDNKPIDNFFIELEPTKLLKEETGVFTPSRYYISLNNPVLELYEDRGIDRMWTNSKQIIYKTHPSRFDVIDSIEWATPSATNLVYYREGARKVIIEGIDPVDIDDVSIFVWYIPRQDIECIADNDEVKITSELAATLLELVEAKARQQFFGGINDEESDGSQNLPMVNG